MPVLEFARLIHGHMRWCTGSGLYIRSEQEDTTYQEFLVLYFTPDNSSSRTFTTLRQDPEGKGYDFQHTKQSDVTWMFFPTRSITDRETPLYLFTATTYENGRPTVDMETRSEAIVLDELGSWKTGDQDECAICLDNLGASPDTLVCGHSYHLICLCQSQKQLNCSACKIWGERGALPKAWKDWCQQANHIVSIKCPTCRQISL